MNKQFTYRTAPASSGDTPLYVTFLVGLGAWLTLILTFFTVYMFFDPTKVQMIIISLFGLALGFGVRQSLPALYPQQLGAAFIIISTVFASGSLLAVDSYYLGILLIMLTLVALIRMEKNSYFLGVFLVQAIYCVTTLITYSSRMAIYGNEVGSFTSQLVYHVFLSLFLCICYGGITAEKSTYDLRPMGYMGMFGIYFTHLFYDNRINADANSAALIFTVTLALFLLLSLASAVWRSHRRAFMLLAPPLALLCFIFPPGMGLGAGMALLAYADKNKYAAAGGVLIFLMGLSDYYYNLELILLYKSMVLIGSGCVTLVLTYYFYDRKRLGTSDE